VRTEGKNPYLPYATEPSARSPGDTEGEFVHALERGLAVIRAFGFNRVKLTVTEVAEATGLTRATARRFLHTLVQLGYVHNEGREFSLRPRILELGYAYLSGFSLNEVAQPFMQELAAKVQESTSVAVLDGDDIVYVAHAAPKRVMTINVPIGGRDPAYCTALGRALLAARPDEEIDTYLRQLEPSPYTGDTVTDPQLLRGVLTQVREAGYALVQNEFEDGLVAIAIPIRDASGNVIAAMNVSAYAMRTGPEVLEKKCLPLLRDAVNRLEGDLRLTVG
jgi:IclR family transcriptional regulator, pca regulon regulatory protein